MLPWQPFLAFYIWGAYWPQLKNTTEPSMCGGDAALSNYFDHLLLLLTVGLAESNGSRPTACTLGSAPGPVLGIEYGKPLPFYLF